MSKKHTVEQGECLRSIASSSGLVDWKSIYNDAANESLRAQRTDPNLLCPGDVVMVPESMPKMVECATDDRHCFVRKLTRPLLLELLDEDHNPLSNWPYELSYLNRQINKATDGSGCIKLELPVQVVDVLLTLAAREGWAEVTWSLKVGFLEPVDTVAGIQSRLCNLGYECGPITGHENEQTKLAVRLFQADHKPLEVDGIAGGKTQAELVTQHGC